MMYRMKLLLLLSFFSLSSFASENIQFQVNYKDYLGLSFRQLPKALSYQEIVGLDLCYEQVRSNILLLHGCLQNITPKQKVELQQLSDEGKKKLLHQNIAIFKEYIELVQGIKGPQVDTTTEKKQALVDSFDHFEAVSKASSVFDSDSYCSMYQKNQQDFIKDRDEAISVYEGYVHHPFYQKDLKDSYQKTVSLGAELFLLTQKEPGNTVKKRKIQRRLQEEVFRVIAAKRFITSVSEQDHYIMKGFVNPQNQHEPEYLRNSSLEMQKLLAQVTEQKQQNDQEFPVDIHIDDTPLSDEAWSSVQDLYYQAHCAKHGVTT